MLETSASHMTALVHILCVRSTVAFSHTWCTARPNPPAGGGAQKEEKGRAHKAMGQSRAAAAGRQQRQQGDGQAGRLRIGALPDRLGCGECLTLSSLNGFSKRVCTVGTSVYAGMLSSVNCKFLTDSCASRCLYAPTHLRASSSESVGFSSNGFIDGLIDTPGLAVGIAPPLTLHKSFVSSVLE